MSNTKEPWFVRERSEALAGLLLTSRDDVRVQNERKLDDGVDFLVGINTGEQLSTRLFVVQVKGTTSSNPNDWMQNVKQLFKGGGSLVFLPACVFVVNVRDNSSQYAWVAEPVVEAKGANLIIHEDGRFQGLDTSAVTEIVERVKAWYDALPKQIMPA
jgi:Domain of unknown function (DUF4365)